MKTEEMKVKSFEKMEMVQCWICYGIPFQCRREKEQWEFECTNGHCSEDLWKYYSDYNLHSNQLGKPNYHVGRNRPRIVRMQSIFVSFLIAWHRLQLRTQSEKTNLFLKPVVEDSPVLISPNLASPCQWFTSRTHLKPSFLFPIKLSTLLTVFKSHPNANDRGWLPCYSLVWINSLF